MLKLYRLLTVLCTPFLKILIKKRLKKGKEDQDRYTERMGQTAVPRPKGALLWFHAASVGEAQSTLILINALVERLPDISILVTTGTVTSAKLLDQRLPEQAIHQYYPIDHPKWVTTFLDHWMPDAVVWMESELWPNMLLSIQKRNITAALVNARLSPKSFKSWKRIKRSARRVLNTFTVCITQTKDDAVHFEKLGHENVIVSDNLKYASKPLPYDEEELKKLRDVTKNRPLWLMASTHKGEEDIAFRIHLHLKKIHQDLLTIIVPRHPERRDAIKPLAEKFGLKAQFRHSNHLLPIDSDDVYIADTIGELGLFYQLSPIAFIGRSLSTDGGGGHNPIEAAQMSCAILHGPKIQNLQKIYDDFSAASATLMVRSEEELQNKLEKLLSDEEGLNALQNKASNFAAEKAKVLDKIINSLEPVVELLEDKSKENVAA